MANQNIGTPRLYIDKSIYFRATGQFAPETDFEANFTDLNPSHITQYNFSFGIDMPTFGSPLNYVAFLGHDIGKMYVERMNPDGSGGYDKLLVGTEVVNYSSPGEGWIPNTDLAGYSIIQFPNNNTYEIIRAWVRGKGEIEGDTPGYLGAISIGQYYEMPHSPELSLTLGHEYKGITKQTTMGGSTLTNTNYYKPPKWGDLEAWQLGGIPRKYSGRRVWDLSFNYLNDEDLEPAHYNMDESTTENTWRANWFSNVLHYTMGGALPFIFQPNKDATYTPSNGEITAIPEFAICRFDMDTFSREQVANSVYNIKVKIKESW